MEHIFSVEFPPKIGCLYKNKSFHEKNAKSVALVQSEVILNFMKYAGLLLCYEKNDQIQFHTWNTSVLYGVVVYLIIMYHIITMLMNHLYAFMEESYDSKFQAFQIVVFILSLQTVLIPVSFWGQTTGLIDYFRNWYQFQLLYCVNASKEIKIDVQRMVKKNTFLVLSVSLVISTTICCCFRIEDFTFSIFFTYFSICSFINISISFWVCQCILIQSGAKLLQQFFQQLISSVGKSSQDIILVCFETWIALNNVLKSLSINFSFLITTLCFCSFLSTLITTYCFVSQMFISSKTSNFDVSFAVMNLVLSIWTFSLQSILNDSSYNTTKKVDFRRWIVTVNLNGLTEDLQNQILEFLCFIENQNPRVGLFEFEFLSREFIITISSTLITYIIIILQFQNSGVHSSTNLSKTTCTNVTSL